MEAPISSAECQVVHVAPSSVRQRQCSTLYIGRSSQPAFYTIVPLVLASRSRLSVSSCPTPTCCHDPCGPMECLIGALNTVTIASGWGPLEAWKEGKLLSARVADLPPATPRHSRNSSWDTLKPQNHTQHPAYSKGSSMK